MMPKAFVVVGWILAAIASLATISSWYMDLQCRTSGQYCEIVSEISRVIPFLDRMSADAGVCLSEQARAAALAAPGRRHVVGCVTGTGGTGPSHARFTAGMADGERVAGFDQFSCYTPDWTEITHDLAGGTLIVACNWPDSAALDKTAFSVVRVYQNDRLDASEVVFHCACKELFVSDLMFDTQGRMLSAALKTDAVEIELEGTQLKIKLDRQQPGTGIYALSVQFGRSAPVAASTVWRAR